MLTMHITAGLELTHCPGALSRSTALSSDPDGGGEEAKWSLNLDPRFASDLDPRSRVESPSVSWCTFLFATLYYRDDPDLWVFVFFFFLFSE